MNILFVCKSNAGRSQIAEAFLEKMTGGKVKVSSAGFDVKDESQNLPISFVTDKVVTAMDMVGIDMRQKKMKKLTKEMVDEASKIISFESIENLPVFLQKSTKLEIWDTKKIEGEGQEFFDNLRDYIGEKVDSMVKKL